MHIHKDQKAICWRSLYGGNQMANTELKTNSYFKNKMSKNNEYSPSQFCPNIKTQKRRLEAAFPELKFTNVKAIVDKMKITEIIDNIIIFPKLSALGKIFKIDNPYEHYQDLVEHILIRITDARNFCNDCRNNGSNHFRNETLIFGGLKGKICLDNEVKSILERLESADENDFLVLQINSDNQIKEICHDLNDTKCQTRYNTKKEIFPLSFVQISCMLITNRFLLSHQKDMDIICLGDEFWETKNNQTYLSFHCSSKRVIAPPDPNSTSDQYQPIKLTRTNYLYLSKTNIDDNKPKCYLTVTLPIENSYF